MRVHVGRDEGVQLVAAGARDRRGRERGVAAAVDRERAPAASRIDGLQRLQVEQRPHEVPPLVGAGHVAGLVLDPEAARAADRGRQGRGRGQRRHVEGSSLVPQEVPGHPLQDAGVAGLAGQAAGGEERVQPRKSPAAPDPGRAQRPRPSGGRLRVRAAGCAPRRRRSRGSRTGRLRAHNRSGRTGSAGPSRSREPPYNRDR